MRKVNVRITDKSIPAKKQRKWENIIARELDKHVCWFCGRFDADHAFNCPTRENRDVEEI